MFVFKLHKETRRAIKLSVSNFENETKRAPPYIQEINGITKYYALCPACDNPIRIVNLYVKDQEQDESKRSMPMHARHHLGDVVNLATYDQLAYDNCPFSNPHTFSSKSRRAPGKESNEILDLIRKHPDYLALFVRRTIGITLSDALFQKMLESFCASEGHLYRYVNRFNLPYAFMHMTGRQPLLWEYLEDNQAGSELRKAIEMNSEFFKVNYYGRLLRKVKTFVTLEFYFVDHVFVKTNEGDCEQRFTMIIAESEKERGVQKNEREIFRKDVIFDSSFYLNLVDKREHLMSIVRAIIG